MTINIFGQYILNLNKYFEKKKMVQLYLSILEKSTIHDISENIPQKILDDTYFIIFPHKLFKILIHYHWGKMPSK